MHCRYIRVPIIDHLELYFEVKEFILLVFPQIPSFSQEGDCYEQSDKLSSEMCCQSLCMWFPMCAVFAETNWMGDDGAWIRFFSNSNVKYPSLSSFCKLSELNFKFHSNTTKLSQIIT